MDKELPVSPWPEWKIIEKIGEGSYGKVYKAQRTERGKTFHSAIKVINIPGSQGELNSVRSETGDERSTREYFQNLVEECIQEVATMEYFRGNSYIVSVEDFKVMEYLDAIGWEIYIRMEFLTSFMDYCAGKQLTEKEVIQLGLDLCRSLEYCAKLKIIHRDIKPENIFVSRFGDFKLGDFGIARELERTMGGLSKKGTYSYMAPEMYRGERYDSRVDIYSLGIVLYKLMNRNRLPFLNLEKQFITYRDKENALTRRMSGEKLSNPADAGEDFSQIILKACAHDPQERYQTPEEFYKALDDLKNGRRQTEIPKPAVVPAAREAAQQIPMERQKASAQQNADSAHTRPASVQRRTVSVQPRTSEGRTSEGVSRRPRRKKYSHWTAIAVVLGITALVVWSIFIKMMLEGEDIAPEEQMVNILEDEKYSPENSQEAFAQAIETIKDRATTISDNMDTYDWIGTEGDRIRYYDHSSGEYMKVLVYPASSEDEVYEEYYYWNEQLFFAYIWYDEEAELYYYDDDGDLIRWIDADEVCHDNETDNKEFVKRGEKYWEKAAEELE